MDKKVYLPDTEPLNRPVETAMPSTRSSILTLTAFVLCAVSAYPQAATPTAVPLPLGSSAKLTPSPTSVSAADTAKASGLINESSRLIQRRDFTGARQKLDEAEAIDTQQIYLWANYGALALAENKPDEAIDNLQHELINHPDEYKVSTLLVQVQVQQHKSQDAIATLQKALAADPANGSATGSLGSLLFASGDYPAVEKLARGTLTTHPNNAQMQILLGTTLVREGKKSEAAELLKPIAQNSQDLGAVNDAAFVLADNNLDVPLAEQACRRALASLEQQSGPLDTDTVALLHTEMFVSIWDTLGWSLFLQGKTTEAEPLIRAAWSNSFAAESGYHLGMVLEKLGQPAKALAVYQLALFGDAPSDPAITDNNKARQDALRKAGTPNPAIDGKTAMQALRNFRIPGPNKFNGQALIKFEFSTSMGPSNATIVRDLNEQDRLTPVESKIYLLDFKTTLPPGSRATLTRHGILTCHAGAPCEFSVISTHAALTY
jgi:tetratricopeptide (TPR) repeat protein